MVVLLLEHWNMKWSFSPVFHWWRSPWCFVATSRWHCCQLCLWQSRLQAVSAHIQWMYNCIQCRTPKQGDQIILSVTQMEIAAFNMEQRRITYPGSKIGFILCGFNFFFLHQMRSLCQTMHFVKHVAYVLNRHCSKIQLCLCIVTSD